MKVQHWIVLFHRFSSSFLHPFSYRLFIRICSSPVTYNIFYGSQHVFAIGIFDQNMDYSLKFSKFECVIHINILVKNADGQNRLGTVENIVTGDEHIREKCL